MKEKYEKNKLSYFVTDIFEPLFGSLWLGRPKNPILRKNTREYLDMEQEVSKCQHLKFQIIQFFRTIILLSDIQDRAVTSA